MTTEISSDTKVIDLVSSTGSYKLTVLEGRRYGFDIICRNEFLKVHWKIVKDGDSTNTVIWAGTFSPEDKVRRSECTLYVPGTYTLTVKDGSSLVTA